MRRDKYLIVLLSCLLVFSLLPLASLADEKNSETNSDIGKYSTKDEVVFGKLDLNGKPKNMYVVNSFNVTRPGQIVDYGKYNDIRNLTDLSIIEQVGSNEVHFDAQEDFYYQGELENKPLPWDISITYLLDGKKVNPNELAGQSGKLEIHITTAANKEVNQVFFEYYLLQISLKLDPLHFEDILAPKGTEAKEGKDRIISFNVMPEQEEEIVVSANVSNLEMEPIDIVAIPANIAIENPDTADMTDDMKELSNAIRDIHSGVGDLKSGIAELNNGASELSKGSNAYQKGLNELNQSSGELVDGSSQILGALKQINGALENSSEIPDLGGLAELPSSLRAMAEQLRGLDEALTQLKSAIDTIPNNQITEEQFQKLYAEINNADDIIKGVVAQLVETYSAVQVIKAINEQIPNNASATMATFLEEMASGLDEAMSGLTALEELDQLLAGLKTLSSEYEMFHNGLITYTDGVRTLASSYAELNSGTKELSVGTSKLNDGIRKLHDGTKELEDSTGDLPNQMQIEIDKFMEEFDYSNFEATSFVSSKNDDVGVVQFVLQTEAIEIVEKETIMEEDEVKTGFWNRFMNLFKK